MASIVWISYTTRGWYLLANVNCISFVSKSINLTEILSIFLSHIPTTNLRNLRIFIFFILNREIDSFTQYKH